MKRVKVIVCGVKFGQFYIEGLKKYNYEFELAGIMSTGSEASKACAEKYGVKLFTSVKDLPDDIDIACVIVRSGVLGGEGTELAESLLKRGINVICEQPIHMADLASLLRSAKANKVLFKTADFYLELPVMRKFIDCASILAAKKKCQYVEVTCANQVSFTMFDILMHIFSAKCRIEIEKDAEKCGPYKIIKGKIGGTPVLFKIYNMINSDDPDGSIYNLHQFKLEFADGTLSLEDTHGPISWQPQFLVMHNYFMKDRALQEKLKAKTITIYEEDKLTNFEDILSNEWPEAIGKAVLNFKNAIFNNRSLVAMQNAVINASYWNTLTEAAGHPDFISRAQDKVSGDSILKDLMRVKKQNSRGYEGLVPAEVNEIYIQKCMDIIKQASLNAMLSGLYLAGGFKTYLMYSLDEIYERLNCLPKFQRIVKRWLYELVKAKLVKEENSKYMFLKNITLSETLDSWEEVKELWSRGLCSQNVIDYYIKHVKSLPELLRGEVNAMHILFPEGDIDKANLFYRETLMEKYLAEAIADYAVKITSLKAKKSLKILELGGGTGATTDCVLRRLNEEDKNAEYIFSDISKYFLSHAEEKYADLDFMKYKVIDIDKDLEKQEIKKESIDIVIAAGMLNNAEDTEEVMKRIVKVLKRDGMLLLSEPVGESMELLISQSFMMTPPVDKRKDKNSTFYTLEEWQETLESNGLKLVKYIPDNSHVLAALNQKLFIAKKIDCMKEGKI